MRDREEFLTIGGAAARLGVSRTTIARRVAACELRVHVTDANRRVRLIRARDVALLASPRPLPPRSAQDEAPSGA